MHHVGLFFLCMFAVLVLAPGMTAWFLGVGKSDRRAMQGEVLEFPETVAREFKHREIDAA